MFSGKSEELGPATAPALIARQKIQVFKPRADTRHHESVLVTRDNRELAAFSVSSSQEMRQNARSRRSRSWGSTKRSSSTTSLSDLVTDLADQGIRVIVAGLDQDYPAPAVWADAPYPRAGGVRRQSPRGLCPVWSPGALQPANRRWRASRCRSVIPRPTRPVAVLLTSRTNPASDSRSVSFGDRSGRLSSSTRT